MGGHFWFADSVWGGVWGILRLCRDFLGGPSLCGVLCGVILGKYHLGGVSGVGTCWNNFSRVWGGVGEGWCRGLPGFELFLGGIFCVGRDFLVCGQYGVLRVGDSS